LLSRLKRKIILFSGVFGGTVHEAMTDLIYMMNTLIDKDGKYGFLEL
jgi:hypothetical protein